MKDHGAAARRLEYTQKPAHLTLVVTKPLGHDLALVSQPKAEVAPYSRKLMLVNMPDTLKRRALHARMNKRQAQRHMRRQVKTLVNTIIVGGLIFSALLVVMSIVIQVQHSQVQSMKSTVVSEQIYVQPGESLWSIAEKHAIIGVSTSDTLAYIKEINHLEGNTIKAGQTLKVPTSSEATPAP